jgi:UDP-N-acetylmuramyl pentapeptide phosphotransferase/UDP-N-acetylglucosamine-1-phosphate transferase
MNTHKVGTITLGGMLIVFGILFFIRIFFTSISYDIIFKLWPIIFISLGIEVLTANFKQPSKSPKLVYDTTAFVLIILLSLFAIGMAIADFCMTHAVSYISIH